LDQTKYLPLSSRRAQIARAKTPCRDEIERTPCCVKRCGGTWNCRVSRPQAASAFRLAAARFIACVRGRRHVRWIAPVPSFFRAQTAPHLRSIRFERDFAGLAIPLPDARSTFCPELRNGRCPSSYRQQSIESYAGISKATPRLQQLLVVNRMDLVGPFEDAIDTRVGYARSGGCRQGIH